ncbi:hypothetical protein C8J56DRAFT_1056976 [Mycena floridula]|nr:hypothetical protein C8J56DRAFT_1056976 [Mycena floridula]
MPKDNPLLNNTNYCAWAFWFLAKVKTKEYNNILLDTEPILTTGTKAIKSWQKRHDVAVSDIISEVENDQHAHSRGLKDDAVVMWKALALFHNTGSASSDLLGTWNEFHQANYTNHSIHLKSHISSIIEIAGQLKTQFSSPPTEEQITARILSSLSVPKFDDILHLLDGHPQIDDCTWVVTRLLKEELVIRHKGRLSGIITKTGQSSLILHALATRSNSTLTTTTCNCCSNCHQLNHDLPYCFQPGGPLEHNLPTWVAELGARREAEAAAKREPQVLMIQTIAM